MARVHAFMLSHSLLQRFSFKRLLKRTVCCSASNLIRNFQLGRIWISVKPSQLWVWTAKLSLLSSQIMFQVLVSHPMTLLNSMCMSPWVTQHHCKANTLKSPLIPIFITVHMQRWDIALIMRVLPLKWALICRSMLTTIRMPTTTLPMSTT